MCPSNLLCLFLLLCLPLLAIDVKANGQSWTCDRSSLAGYVDKPIEPMKCRLYITAIPYVYPPLPSGLVARFVVDPVAKGYYEISGTPVHPHQRTVYSIRSKDHVSFFSLGVIGKPTALSYGFNYMVMYAGLPMEPLLPHSDAELTHFYATPEFPSGVHLNSTTGAISGFFPNTASSGTRYTITGANSVGSVTTVIRLIVKDSSDMVESGFTSCHWLHDTYCDLPPMELFYDHPAVVCKHETELNYVNTNEEHIYPMPGLDYRFQHNYLSLFYGFINIIIPASYRFSVNADSSGLLYVDNVDVPLVDLDHCKEGHTGSASIQLTQGRHIFMIKYTQLEKQSNLTVKLSSEEAGIDEMNLNSAITKVGGRGPSFITYPLIVGYAGVSMQLYAPQRVSGTVDTWSVTPELPSGLLFDAQTGEISGRTMTPYSGDHTVTAVGVNGEASTAIHVEIGNSPIQGIRAHYYTIKDGSVCTLPSFSQSQLELRVTRTESRLDFQGLPGMADGLPTDSVVNYAEWESYLFFGEVGNWKLRLSCAGACRLWSKNTLEIDLWTPKKKSYCHDYASEEMVVPVVASGYYYIKVNHSPLERDDAIMLEWCSPTGDWEVVPEARFFFVPTTQLVYDYEKMDLFKGQQITVNKPHSIIADACSGYFAAPALPDGLHVDRNSGYITGVPTTDQNEKEYVITCSTGKATLSTTIHIAVHTLSPPSNVGIVFRGKVVGDEVILLTPFVVNNAFTSVNVTHESYTFEVSPALPRGLSVDRFTGGIGGSPAQPIPNSLFTLITRNPAGATFTPFRLEVAGCFGVTESGEQWTNPYLILQPKSSGVSITVNQGGKEAQCSFGKYNDDGSMKFERCRKSLSTKGVTPLCVKPEANTTLTMKCGQKEGCYLSMVQPDGMRWPLLFMNATETPQLTMPIPTTSTPLTSVAVVPSEITTYREITIPTISVVPNGSYRSVSIASSAGSFRELDAALPEISGVLYGVGTVVYTITAVGEISVSSTLTVHFKDCNEDGKTLLRMELFCALFPTEISYEVYKDSVESGKLVVSRQGESQFYTHINVACVDAGFYAVVLKGSFGTGWSDRSYLKVVNDDNQRVDEFTFPFDKEHPVKEKYVNFTLSTGHAYRNWRMSTTPVDQGWPVIDFDDSTWGETQFNKEHGEWAQNTLYLRYAFDVEDVTNCQLVQFGLWYKDGVIAYLNGVEVYRRNLPTGKLSALDYASDTYEAYCLYPSTAPGYYLTTGKNVLAVEIHRHKSTTGTLFFHGYVNPVFGASVGRVFDGVVIEPPYFNHLNDSSIAAWESLTNTYWMGNTVPIWTVYQFNYGREEWVNTLALDVLKQSSARPTSIRLSGSKDGVEWKELLFHSDRNLFKKTTHEEFRMMDHMDTFSSYKFEVLECSSELKRVTLSTIDLRVSRLDYCVMRDGFHGVMPGETSITPCPSGYIGDMYRECQLVEDRPTWGAIDRGECHTIHPRWKHVFVDIVYAITKENENHLRSVRTILEAAYAHTLDVKKKDIEIWKTKDVSAEYPDYPIVTAFWIRVSGAEKEKATLYLKVTNALINYQNVLSTFYKEQFPDGFALMVYKDAVLREAKDITYIIVITVVLVVFISIAAFVLWIRLKPNRRSIKHIKKNYGYMEDHTNI